MFKQDWMERQIESLSKSFTALLFGKERLLKILDEYEDESISNSADEEILDRILKKYLEDGNINKAENILFDSINQHKTLKKLITAFNFYDCISQWDDEKLKDSNFSKQEITEAIGQLKDIYKLHL